MRDGMDALKEAIEDHFSSQDEELKRLREEVEELTSGKPSLFWMSTGRYANSSYRWTCPKVLDWTDGRLYDFQRDVSNGAALLSAETDAIRAEVKQYRKKVARRRSNWMWGLVYAAFLLAVITSVLLKALSA